MGIDGTKGIDIARPPNLDEHFPSWGRKPEWRCSRPQDTVTPRRSQPVRRRSSKTTVEGPPYSASEKILADAEVWTDAPISLSVTHEPPARERSSTSTRPVEAACCTCRNPTGTQRMAW